jgi:hypothetical protein
MNQPCDKVFAFGQLRLLLTDEHGAVKQDEKVQNLVVTTGLGFIASRMKDATATVMTHMAIGSGAVSPVLGNTALGTELGRVALANTVVAANVVTYTATFPAGTGTGSITEAGIFNASSSGTMLNRVTFGVITKAAGDSLAVTWTVTVS